MSVRFWDPLGTLGFRSVDSYAFGCRFSTLRVRALGAQSLGRESGRERVRWSERGKERERESERDERERERARETRERERQREREREKERERERKRERERIKGRETLEIDCTEGLELQQSESEAGFQGLGFRLVGLMA